ncbi:hypothetical protein C7C56_020010 [Massilia glaciei]|uniref:Uncharacterized protein n=1 Tax=Massilia glaciei TaxID=1524097 RepID=A0A2U2HGG4_9BURK|nr:hypothetical protein C7C56_020010 [Massilia glaciei]
MLCGFIFLVLAILACVVLFRKGLLRREESSWNTLAKISYLLILICLPTAGAALGAAYSTHRSANALLDDAMRPALTSRMPLVRAYLNTQLASYRPDGIFRAQDLAKTFIRDLRYRPQSDRMWEPIHRT